MSLALKSFKRHHLWKTLFVVCFILLVGSFFTNNYEFLRTGSFVAVPNQDKGEQVTLDFYVMSKCHYGVQAEDAVAPVLKEMGEAVDFNLYFIGGITEEGLQSLQGQPEVEEDMRQICVQKYFPDKLMDYVVCQNKDIVSAESNWKNCAEENDIEVSKIEDCFNSGEGETLLIESFEKSEEIGAFGSPTIYLNDELYDGGRNTDSFKIAICKHLKDNPACVDVPACEVANDCEQLEGKNVDCQEGECVYSDPVKVEVIVLNDENCVNCDTYQIIAATENFFPGVEIKEVDVSSDEGKVLVEKYGIELVPAYLFDKNLEKTQMWLTQPEMATSFEETVDGYKLLDEATGANHWVNEEKRQMQEEQIDSLAECLAEKGLVMYGSEGCGYCQMQKDFFGNAFEKINYVSCDEEPLKCQEAGISGYPSWKINGEIVPGLQQINALAELAECEFMS